MSAQQISERARRIPPSETLAISARVAVMRAGGRDVVSLAAGEPDFDTPAHIKEAAVRAIERGQTKYTPASGTPALRAAVADRTARATGVAYTAEDAIVCAGAKQALHNVCQAVLDPGSEAVVVAPYWVSYPPMVEAAGARTVLLETRMEDGYRIDPGRLRRALTERTRIVFLNSPCNPTGAVYDREALLAVAEVILERPGLLVVSDEIYDTLVFDGAQHCPFASLGEDLARRTVTVGGVSKTYAMTGWRIGWAVGPREVIDAADRIQSHATSGPNSIAQAAALEALTGPQACVARMAEAFDERRRALLSHLSAIPGIETPAVRGTFYAFPRVSALYGPRIASSAAFAQALLDAEAVAVVPGGAFGADGHVRLSFAISTERIVEAVARLRRFALTLGT